MTRRRAQSTFESLKGITFNRWDADDPLSTRAIRSGCTLIRINSRTGKREVLSNDARLFDFTVSTAFLPPVGRGRDNPLVTASDQEYRWSGPTPRSTASTRSSCRSSVSEYYPKHGR